jgi:signal transduction histidine kinase
VIDDEAGPRLSLQLILEQRFRVLTASCADEGLRVLGSERIALVMLDLNMPGLDGGGALARMRESGMDVPVIIVTGFGAFENARHALRMRAADFISKPFSSDEIMRAADLALARWHDRAVVRDRSGLPGSEQPALGWLVQLTSKFSASPTSAQMLEHVAGSVQSAIGRAGYRVSIIEVGAAAPVPQIAVEALKRARPMQAPTQGLAPSLLALPIHYAGTPLGALLVEADRGGRAFEPDEVELWQVIANAAALALENARKSESLTEIEQAKSEFLGNLSHELRTPLNAVVGFAELAGFEAAEAGNPQLDDCIARIARNAADLCGQVDNLIGLSRATLGREQRRIGRVNVRSMLEGVLQLARRHIPPRRTIDLQLDVDRTIGELYTDAEKLERIAQILVTNAIKFTEHGWVRVAARLLEADAGARLPNGTQPWERIFVLRIADSGIGIAPEHLGKIFQPFHQESRGAARRFGGLGIGLTLARQLAEILGGTMTVESALKRGSSFEVMIPVYAGADA